MNTKPFVFILFFLLTQTVFASDKTTLRLGVLAYGTVNWELETIKNQNQLESSSIQLEITPIANPQAGKIALQSKAVDMIISDWIWVSRQRAAGMDLTFFPYSTTSGALLIPETSAIQSIADLKGKKLGIAGGELDKNWLLLQALAKQTLSLDLNTSVEKVFAAPPLLNQQLKQNRIDAMINYWHHAAKLEPSGYQQLLDGQGILKGLGIETAMPFLGYVFHQTWAKQHQTSLNAFLKTTQKAKSQICQNDEAWQQIIPLTRIKDSTTQSLLRSRYCHGLIKEWNNKHLEIAEQIYQLLRKSSHNKLTGNSSTIQPGTFWTLN